MGEREVAGWVWSENLQGLLLLVSNSVSYAFGESDWQAVENALPETDNDAVDGWYEYHLWGSPPLSVRLARDIEGDEVSIRISGRLDDVLAARLDALLEALAVVRGLR